MTLDVATRVDLYGAHVCNQQRHLLVHQLTTPAQAAARIVHAIHLQAGLTPPKEKP